MNLADLFSTQGHGPYILGSYAVGALLMGIEVVRVVLRFRRARAAAAQPLTPEDLDS